MLTAGRKGLIALLVLRIKLREEGIVLGLELRERAEEIAQKTTIPVEEVMEFLEEFVRDMVDEIFAKPKAGKAG